MRGAADGDIGLLRRLLLEARPYWPHLGGILLLDLLATPLALLTPLPVKIVVDSVLGDHHLPAFLAAIVPAAWQNASALLTLAVALLIVTAALSQLQTIGSTILQAYAGGRMVLDFRNVLFAHGQKLSLLRHDTKGVTDALYRIQYDSPAIENIVIHSLIPMFTSIVTVVAMVYVTMKISLNMALVALLIAPVIIVLSKIYRQPLRNRWRQQKMLEHAAMSVINEVFSALRVVKAFNQEEREGRRYSREASAGLFAKLQATLLQGTFDLAVSVTVAVGTGIVLYTGVRSIQSGAMSVGDLLVVMSYLALLYAPLKSIGARVATMQSSLAGAERAYSLLDESTDVPERTDALPLASARGEFEFRNVSFGYGGHQPVLQGVSLYVPAGSSVGVIGRTGAGKTTLISLLMRFYDPSAGVLLLDGRDIRDYRLKDLRRQFSLVLQDTVLFSTSIRDNIAYARPEASDEEIVAAARSAGAHEFICACAEGYDTRVGERGMRLSGGERQRIALARAFLRDAPVLVLDEPTSAVDTATEEAIMEAMTALKAGRTTFMIAHRLSTLRGCDMLIRIDGGRVASIVNGTSNVMAAVG